MRSPAAGRRPAAFAATLLAAIALAGGLAIAPAAAAVELDAPVVTPVAPAEGALVSGDPVLTWTPASGSGYELRWNTDGSEDADGALDPEASGGRAYPGSATHQLLGLESPVYFWQVRALPSGEWSAVTSFHLDIQLETLDLGSATDMPAPSGSAPVESTPDAARPVFDAAAQGFIWIASASSIAGLILAFVGREWLRLRRQPES